MSAKTMKNVSFASLSMANDVSTHKKCMFLQLHTLLAVELFEKVLTYIHAHHHHLGSSLDSLELFI